MSFSLFAQPIYLLLIIPLIFLFYYVLRHQQQKKASLLFSSLQILRSQPPTLRVYLKNVPLLLLFVGLVFLIVSLARPQKSNEKIKKSVEGIDIMIVFDISDSMLIEDMKPENRLEASKQIISNFVRNRTSDRIGIVVFAGEAYTRVPLTMDYELLLENISQIQTTRNIKMGTAIGVGLAVGVARLKESAAKSRILIFMTDGENNSGTIDPDTALKLAVEEGIKIYSIGVGKDGEARLPVFIQDAFGNRIKQYRPIHSKINEPLLKNFADSTGGRFWRAITGQELDEVFKTINNLEKTKIDVESFIRYTELFQNPLRIGFYFILSALILGQTWLRRGP